MPSADTSMEVRLERIQAAIDVGNVETKGKFELLMERLDNSKKLAEERENRGAAELKERDTQLKELKERQDAMQLQQDRLGRKLAFAAGGISALGVVANVGVQLLMHH